MKARFPGTCKGGRDAVNVGDEITADRGGWSHPAHKAPVNRFGPLNSNDFIENDAFRRVPRPSFMPGDPDSWGDRQEAFLAAEQKRRDNAEYAAGIEDARRERFNRDTFGEQYAAAEEYARDLRGLNGDW